MATERMTVVRFPALARSKNDYTASSTTGFDRTDFVDWSLWTLALGRYQAVHLNWPESRWTRHGLVPSLLGTAELILGLLLAHVHRAAVVLTLHNAEPHDCPHPRLHRAASRLLKGLIGGLVVLNEADLPATQAYNAAAPVTVACLGSYEWAAPHGIDTREQDAPGGPPVVLSHGLQRPYKQAAVLVAASAAAATAHRLVIIGEFDQEELRACLLVENSRAAIRPRRQSRAELVAAHREATVVIVPYRRIENPSSLLLSLCLGVPVAAPALPALRRMRDAVGADWMHLWEGDLTPQILEDAMAWARSPRSGCPDLRTFSWPRHRQAVEQLYIDLIGGGAGRRRGALERR